MQGGGLWKEWFVEMKYKGESVGIRLSTAHNLRDAARDEATYRAVGTFTLPVLQVLPSNFLSGAPE